MVGLEQRCIHECVSTVCMCIEILATFRKIKLYYGDDSSQSQSLTGDLGDFTGVEGQSSKNMCQGGKPDTGRFYSSYQCMWLCL